MQLEAEVWNVMTNDDPVAWIGRRSASCSYPKSNPSGVVRNWRHCKGSHDPLDPLGFEESGIKMICALKF